MSGIFISYRRDDQPGFAGRLADALTAAFGADNVFRDIEDIHPGDDFVDALHQQLRSVDVMLVVIGPDWLATSRNGIRRLDEPADFVRMEIQAGLKSGKTLLPVLVHGAAMPAESDLPAAIGALARRQGFVLSDLNWAADVARLILALQPRLSSRQRLPRSVLLACAVAGIVAIGLAGLGWHGNWWSQPPGVSSKVAAEIARNLAGRWEARVRYDWGAEHDESFDLLIENAEVHGTASYLRLARSIEQGELRDGRLSFVTHSQEVSGDAPPRELTHRYRGALKQGELHFVLESSGGQAPHPPVEFVARRPAK